MLARGTGLTEMANLTKISVEFDKDFDEMNKLMLMIIRCFNRAP